MLSTISVSILVMTYNLRFKYPVINQHYISTHNQEHMEAMVISWSSWYLTKCHSKCIYSAIRRLVSSASLEITKTSTMDIKHNHGYSLHLHLLPHFCVSRIQQCCTFHYCLWRPYYVNNNCTPHYAMTNQYCVIVNFTMVVAAETQISVPRHTSLLYLPAVIRLTVFMAIVHHVHSEQGPS